MDSSSQERSGSLILGNCLNCQGLVRVPARAPAEATARCPHCSESFRLSDILDQAVPELEIVDDVRNQVNQRRVEPRVDREALKEREEFVVPPQLSKGAIRKGRRRSSRSSSASNSRDSSASSSGENSRKSKKIKSARSISSFRAHSTSGLSRGSTVVQRNPTIEMIKVILGGILAIPIAYLILLWVFRQDPLNVGPKVGNIAPFMVPAALRGEIEPEETDSDGINAQPETKPEIRAKEPPVIPKLDPDRVLNPDLDESN